MAQRISPSGLALGGAFVWAATSATGVQASRADRSAETTRTRHRARFMYPSALKGDDRVGARTIAPPRQAVNLRDAVWGSSAPGDCLIGARRRLAIGARGTSADTGNSGHDGDPLLEPGDKEEKPLPHPRDPRGPPVPGERGDHGPKVGVHGRVREEEIAEAARVEPEHEAPEGAVALPLAARERRKGARRQIARGQGAVEGAPGLHAGFEGD